MALFAAILAGCGKDKNGTVPAADIPPLTVTCNQTSSETCGGITTRVFWTEGACDYVALAGDNQYKARGDLVADPGSCVDGSCTLTFSLVTTTWVNSDGDPINSFNRGTYRACAYVDTNGNSSYADSGDYEGSIEPTVINEKTEPLSISSFTAID